MNIQTVMDLRLKVFIALYVCMYTAPPIHIHTCQTGIFIQASGHGPHAQTGTHIPSTYVPPVDNKFYNPKDLNREDLCWRILQSKGKELADQAIFINTTDQVSSANDRKSKLPFALLSLQHEKSCERMRVCYVLAGGSTGQYDVAQINKPPIDGRHSNETCWFHEGKFSKCSVTGAKSNILGGAVSGVRMSKTCWRKLFIVWEIQKVTDWKDEDQLDNNLIFCVLDRECIQETEEIEIKIQFSLRIKKNGELVPGRAHYDNMFTFVRYKDLRKSPELWWKLFPLASDGAVV
jgi:hypothetical protein